MTIRTDLLTGIHNMLTTLGVPDAKIVWLKGPESHGPRPALPYVTISILVPGVGKGPAEMVPGLNGSSEPQITARNSFRGTVSIGFFGSSSIDWAHELQLSHDRPDVLTQLETDGISVVPLGGINDVSVLLDTIEEPRYVFDMAIDYQSQGTTADEVELLTVDVSDQFEAYTGDPDPLTLDFTVPMT